MHHDPYRFALSGTFGPEADRVFDDPVPTDQRSALGPTSRRSITRASRGAQP